MAILCYRKGNGRWVHSLRAYEGGRVDCASIGDARGGGGHRTSACYLNKTRFLASGDCPVAQRQPA